MFQDLSKELTHIVFRTFTVKKIYCFTLLRPIQRHVYDPMFHPLNKGENVLKALEILRISVIAFL